MEGWVAYFYHMVGRTWDLEHLVSGSFNGIFKSLKLISRIIAKI